jgi:hypothetical protein
VAWVLTLAVFGGLYWYFGARTSMAPASAPAPKAGSNSTSPSEDPEEADAGVLNAVIEAQNDFGQSARQAATSYAREFGTGAQLQQGDLPRVWPLGDSAVKSVERLASALAGSPGEDALRKLAARYVSSARALAGPLADAERYYGRGAQQDDGWARGKTLHAQLRAGFRDFFAAAEALSVEARRLGTARRARARARLAAAGSTRRVGALDGVDQGRAVVDLLERQLERRDVDAATMKSTLARFQATVDALQVLAADVAGTQHEFGETYAAASFRSFAQQAEYLLRAAREVERESRIPPGSTSERSEAPDEQLVRNFNDMVREANHLSP